MSSRGGSYRKGRYSWKKAAYGLASAGIRAAQGDYFGAGLAAGQGLYQPRAKRSLDFGSAVPAETMDQSSGSRTRRSRMVVRGRKRYNPYKLLKSNICLVEQQLGVFRRGGGNSIVSKHMVSEMDVGSIGCVRMPFANNLGTAVEYRHDTPMHCYDLNFICNTTTGNFVSLSDDNYTNFAPTVTNQNDDVNARAWVWKNYGKWDRIHQKVEDGGVFSHDHEARWYVNPDSLSAWNVPNGAGNNVRQITDRVYRKGLDIRYQLYGAKNTPITYDVRVIKILDPQMCPDYADILDDSNATNTYDLRTFQDYWKQMVYGYTTNPMLSSLEPGTRPKRKWFMTVAKKRVTVGEQTSLVDQVPVVSGRIFVNINENQSLVWDNKGKPATIQSLAGYDNTDVTGVTVALADSVQVKERPHYSSRYYLLIRAVCPNVMAPAKADGAEYLPQFSMTGVVGDGYVSKYCPSYDLAIRHTIMRQKVI